MLCGIALVFLNDMYLEVAGDIFLIFILSLFFSAPGFFIFWIILLIKFCFYITGINTGFLHYFLCGQQYHATL